MKRKTPGIMRQNYVINPQREIYFLKILGTELCRMTYLVSGKRQKVK